jgi:rRNA small subunit pseudouridine methyltransferase Nep1
MFLLQQLPQNHSSINSFILSIQSIMSDDDSSQDHNNYSEDDEEDETKQPANKRTRLLDSTPLDVSAVAVSNASSNKKGNGPKPIIVLLDQATIETVKNKRGVYELLNCDDHRELCKRKLKVDPNHYRPDILHQELLALLDSPLNKAGLLKVYIQTKKNVLIDVHPSIRIPRTYKRFAGLIVQLLHKMKIKAGTESTTLLKIIKNPFSQYLPAGTRCFGMSCKGTLYSPISLASTLVPTTYETDQSQQQQPPTCFIIGAMSTGHILLEDHPYMEKMFSISSYPLSGAAALSRIVTGIEHHWGIV